MPPRREGWGRSDEHSEDDAPPPPLGEDTTKSTSIGTPSTDPEKLANSSRSLANPEKSLMDGTTPGTSRPPSIPPPRSTRTVRRKALLSRFLRPLRAALTPITCSLLVSLTIALVPVLKALFVITPGHSWRAPDNRAPLAALLDTASFLGGITVPLALILLGASFARLRVPRPFLRLPVKAMFAAALGKMVILPAIGVALTQAMTTGGLVPRKAMAERFVMMLLGGTPAAVK